MKIFLRKAKTYSKIVFNEMKHFNSHRKNFGFKIAMIELLDGITLPSKKSWYIKTIEKFVDQAVCEVVEKYQSVDIDEFKVQQKSLKTLEKMPVWCCWWQGEEKMPELVKMCYKQLQNVIPKNVEIHLITLDNYLNYISLPGYIMDKFEKGIISYTGLSDILRHCLMNRYGGYWLDLTVYFTGSIPDGYFTKSFYCQKMYDEKKWKHEACKGRWCGFSMAGDNTNVLFGYMKDAFFYWWQHYDDIPDYVLIDYLLLTGYKYIEEIHQTIDSVEDNNPDIFEMYKYLNDPYSQELYERLTKKNVMHKLTYKMDLKKETTSGELTLYGYLYQSVFNDDVTK